MPVMENSGLLGIFFLSSRELVILENGQFFACYFEIFCLFLIRNVPQCALLLDAKVVLRM